MTKRIAITLPDELIQRIRERAKKEYRSVSKQVKFMIEKGGVSENEF